MEDILALGMGFGLTKSNSYYFSQTTDNKMDQTVLSKYIECENEESCIKRIAYSDKSLKKNIFTFLLK